MNIFAMNEDLMPSDKVINAASFGIVEDLQSALNEGGDPNFMRLDISPTLITTMRQYYDCLELLISKGARSDLPNRTGWTALHEAAQRDDTSFLEVILSAPDQVRIGVKDRNGDTALVSAMQKGSFDNADVLIKASDTIINSSNNEGVSPTLWAAKERKLEWLEWCLKNGGNPDQTDETGLSASSSVADWEDGANLVKSFGAKVSKFEKAKNNSDDKYSMEQEVAETKTVNPFGLGNIKKKNMS